MSNIFPKEESAKSLIPHHSKDEFLCTIWNNKWFKFVAKISRNQELGRNKKHVATRNMSRPETCHDQKPVATRKLCRDQLAVSR